MEKIRQYQDLRARIWEASEQWIGQRRQAAQVAMEAAQESANGESKSSAGDKYETGRAMAQNDRNLYASQWAQWNDLSQQLTRFKNPPADHHVSPGSLIETTLGWFWLSVSLGRLPMDDLTITILSASSPLGKTLVGKKTGDSFSFQGNEGNILGVG